MRKKINEVSFSSKRLFIFLFAIAGVCYYFWTQSRYPVLNLKAMMGERTTTGGIVFDIFFPLYIQDSLILRILKTTVNWYYTNWKGMTFGLIFSGLMISTLSMFKFRRFKNTYLNTLFGMILGAPLGVCANCAAPISRSLYETTKSLETTLASLFSSPALNFVVVAMAFQLLPFEMAITKVASTMLMILVVAPMLGRFFRNTPEHLKNLEEENFCETPQGKDTGLIETKPENWISALLNSIISFGKSLLYICKIALPTMLLAGFLGAIIIEAVPLDSLLNLKLSVAGAVLVALIGTFLPVPMSFDVIIVAILVEAGLHSSYGMILLFTLGIFSVYPFMLMWRTINLKFASSIFTSVMVVGLLGAVAVPYMMEKNSNYLLGVYNSQEKDPLSLVQEIVKKTCLALPSPEKDDCVFRTAHGTNKEEICGLLTEKSANSKCHAKYFGARVDVVKGKRCETLEDQESRELCKYVYGYQLYDEVNFIISRKCQKKLEKDNADICFNNNIFNSSRPITDCENYKSATQIHNCLKFNQRHLNSKSCDILKSNIGKASCEFIVSNRELALRGEVVKSEERIKVKNEVCSKNSSKEYQSYCNSFFIEAYAIKQIRPKACDSITTEFKNKCKAESYAKYASDIYYKLIKKNLTASSFETTENIVASEQSKIDVKSSPVNYTKEFTQENIKISTFPLSKKNYSNSFQRLEGRDIGIVLPKQDLTDILKLPLWASRGMAAGDFDLDRRQDLIFSTSEGPYLYKNLGDLKFQKIRINLSGISKEDLDLSAVSLIDINNDGYLDIYCTSVHGAAYFLLSNKTKFSKVQLVHLPNTNNRYVVQTTSFGDIDKNGWLDIFLGNNPPWTLLTQSPRAENELIMNDQLRWSISPSYKDRILGLSMSSLISDINQDGNLDLWIGTDLMMPDQLLMGKDGGKFYELKNSQKVVPTTPDASMSYDSADINNDLILDVFGVGVGYQVDSQALDAENGYCNFIKNKIDRDSCLINEELLDKYDPDTCKEMTDSKDRTTCFARFFIKSAILQKDIELCKVIPLAHTLSKNCLVVFNSLMGTKMFQPNSEDLPQATRNILLIQNKKGTFDEVAKKWGVASTNWGWNSKFNDYNNDGWQDLYVSTGFVNFRMIGNNYLFMNQKGKKFENKTKDFGIEEVYSSFANVGVDLTNNGNLSIVATSSNGPVRIYMNHATSNSILFNLTQSSKFGNTSAIGAKIIITTNENNSQIREVKASGGFLSFGPYVQHFGLGNSTGVKSVKVIWPDGEITKLQKPFKANQQYLIERS